jgi:hypothetical protein
MRLPALVTSLRPQKMKANPLDKIEMLGICSYALPLILA